MKKALVIIAIAMVMSFVYAAGAQEAPAETKNTIIVAVPADPGDLSPQGVAVAANHRVLCNIYETLIAKQYGYDYAGELAESYGWTDESHYTIKLRSGIKFSDGTPLNAETVLFCLKVDSTVAAFASQWKLVDFDQSYAADDLTVVLTFTGKQAFFEDALSVAYIFSKEAWEADPERMVTKPVGTGPYVFDSSVYGSSVTLKANENYWGGAPAIKEVTFRIISEKTQRLIELESGGVDLVWDVTGDDLTAYKNDKNISTTTSESSNRMCLMMNNSEYSVCSDRRVRQAIAYAIDSAAITANVYQGLGTPSTGFLSQYYQYYDLSLIGKVLCPFDKEKAKALLAEAGYADGLKLVCYTDDNAERKAAAEIMQAMLKEIGITLEFETYENTVRLNRIKDPKGGWDITLSACGKAETLSTISYYLGAKGAIQYKNAEFADLLAELSLCQDPVRCNEICLAMQAMFNEDVPMYPITDNVIAVAYSSKLQNVKWYNRMYLRYDSMSF